MSSQHNVSVAFGRADWEVDETAMVVDEDEDEDEVSAQTNLNLQAHSLEELNDLFGISADIKAQDIHISMEPAELDQDMIVARLVVTFTWFSTMLTKTADKYLDSMTGPLPYLWPGSPVFQVVTTMQYAQRMVLDLI